MDRKLWVAAQIAIAILFAGFIVWQANIRGPVAQEVIPPNYLELYPPPDESVLPNAVSPSEASEQAEIYAVSSGGGEPLVTQIVLDPDFDEVEPGRTQRIWVTTEAVSGVSRAWVVIDTNDTSETLPMVLAEGDRDRGIWFGEWNPDMIEVENLRIYRTKFFIQNARGNIRPINLNWTNN